MQQRFLINWSRICVLQVFLASESVYALASPAAEMLQDTCKKKNIFPWGDEASADASGSLHSCFSVSAHRSSQTLRCRYGARAAPVRHRTAPPGLPWHLFVMGQPPSA